MSGSHLAPHIVAPVVTIHRSRLNQTDSTAALRPLLPTILTSVDLVTSHTISGTEQLVSEH